MPNSSTNSNTVDRRTQGTSCCATLVKVGSLVLLTVLSGLIYAYATSPVSCVVIRDGHNSSQLKWRQKHNSNLQKGERLHLDLQGPESIVVDDKENWYTGLNDGRVVKIANAGKENEAVINLTGFIKYTAGRDRTARRPLGMRLFMGKLYFADTYQGIFSIDLETETWEKIVGYDDVKPPLAFANDLTISTDGEIYFTDATARWQYHNTIYSIMEGECTGRVYKVGINTKRPELVRDHLCFPNGIELNTDEDKLLVSESSAQRISIINLDSKNIEKQVLLHGNGDNIRRSKTGGYWVPLPGLSDSISDFLKPFPFIRNIAAKILGQEQLMKLANINQGTILKLNENFEIEQVHQDLDGKLSWAVTQVQEYQPGKLLLGSFIAEGIVKLDDVRS